MKLSTTEQSAIAVGHEPSVEPPRIDRGQAAAVMDLVERAGVRVASWHGPNRLRFEQYVGVLRVEDLQIEILPKLEGLTEPAQIRKNLLAMLAETQELGIHPSGIVGYLTGDEPFLCALARLYCRRLLEMTRRGLRQEYVTREETLPFVRGKIDWSTHSKHAAPQRVEIPCIFDDRSRDTPLNRALKAALLEAESLLAGARERPIVTELRHAFADVLAQRPSRAALQRIRVDRLNWGTGPILTLAKLLLGNHSPDLGRDAQGRNRSFALVWDMNVLFEEYLGRIVEKVLDQSHLRVELQGAASRYLAVEPKSRRDAFLLRPDILVSIGDEARIVADTKWKRLDSGQANLGVTPGDIYQLLAYARRYDVRTALLIYPHHPALGAAGVLRDFVTHGAGDRPVSVQVVTVDLAALPTVPSQVSSAFRPVLESRVA